MAENRNTAFKMIFFVPISQRRVEHEGKASAVVYAAVLCLCLPALHTRVYFRVLEPGFLGLRASVGGRSTVRADDPLEQF